MLAFILRRYATWTPSARHRPDRPGGHVVEPLDNGTYVDDLGRPERLSSSSTAASPRASELLEPVAEAAQQWLDAITRCVV